MAHGKYIYYSQHFTIKSAGLFLFILFKLININEMSVYSFFNVTGNIKTY